jgi:hypothetical protein
MTLASWIPPITPINITNNLSTNINNTTFLQTIKQFFWGVNEETRLQKMV